MAEPHPLDAAAPWHCKAAFGRWAVQHVRQRPWPPTIIDEHFFDDEETAWEVCAVLNRRAAILTGEAP